MKRDIPCLLFSRDEKFALRAKSFLQELSEIVRLDDVTEFETRTEREHMAVLLIDARTPDAPELIARLREQHPDMPQIVFARPRSEPALEAERLGVFDLEPPEFNHKRLRRIVGNAIRCARLQEEAGALRRQLERMSIRLDDALSRANARGAGEATSPCRFLPPLRHVRDVEGLPQGILESMTHTAVVMRAGVFLRSRDERLYRAEAAVGCREETYALEFDDTHPLALWMEREAQFVSRAGLRHIEDSAERRMLEHALEALGAELIVPLHGRQGLLGWIFLGKRATGEPFDVADLQNITLFAEHVSVAIENAVLYEEVLLQKSFAETLLHTMPTGIVAIGTDGRIRWFNEAAEGILNVSRDQVMMQPVEATGTRLTDALRRSLQGNLPPSAVREWTQRQTRRSLTVQTQRLGSEQHCMGAVAFLRDVTQEHLLNKKQKELERAAFWTDLAASMSHEIRNPLVAIKTFAQLLPERYAEEEFRVQFSQLVSQEVDRLNTVIQQINDFANMRPSDFTTVDIATVVHKAVTQAKGLPEAEGIEIKADVPSSLPSVSGDANALAESLVHVIRNAAEASARASAKVVRVAAQGVELRDGRRHVEITVCDNGGGIPPELRDKIFSPFCTSKNRGMGLGFPITQRIITDHDGQIHVDSKNQGTTVTIVLPSRDPVESENEAPAGSG